MKTDGNAGAESPGGATFIFCVQTLNAALPASFLPRCKTDVVHVRRSYEEPNVDEILSVPPFYNVTEETNLTP